MTRKGKCKKKKKKKKKYDGTMMGKGATDKELFTCLLSLAPGRFSTMRTRIQCRLEPTTTTRGGFGNELLHAGVKEVVTLHLGLECECLVL